MKNKPTGKFTIYQRDIHTSHINKIFTHQLVDPQPGGVEFENVGFLIQWFDGELKVNIKIIHYKPPHRRVASTLTFAYKRH